MKFGNDLNSYFVVISYIAERKLGSGHSYNTNRLQWGAKWLNLKKNCGAVGT